MRNWRALLVNESKADITWLVILAIGLGVVGGVLAGVWLVCVVSVCRQRGPRGDSCVSVSNQAMFGAQVLWAPVAPVFQVPDV